MQAAVLESVSRKKSASKSGTVARKSRAAEVHNLSERVGFIHGVDEIYIYIYNVSIIEMTFKFLIIMQRRRDRINEKMRALQELLPHSNKVCHFLVTLRVRGDDHLIYNCL